MIEGKTEDKKSEQSKERRLSIPGEIIVSGEKYLPGEGTKRNGQNIISNRFGLIEESGRLVRIIPLSGAYSARRGNIVIGRVMDMTFNGWIVDINAPYLAFLLVSECPRFFNTGDLGEYLDIGDMFIAKVHSVKRKGIDLSVKGRDLGKIDAGIIIQINSNKVPRLIGKGGSMVNLIKKETDCKITIGQNGVVWIKGDNTEKELFARDTILFVTEKSFYEGLTEKTKNWIEKMKKGGEEKEK